MRLNKNIFLENFDTFSEMINRKDELRFVGEPNSVLYYGKPSEIWEDLAVKCETTKGIIQELADKKYCLIHKTI